MEDRPPILNYGTRQPTHRVWGLSGPLWLLVAGLATFVEFAGFFATNGRINSWNDIVFIITVAVLGVVAVINAIRVTLKTTS
ncbi:MAG: hypothetical protein QM770_22825 [Tepidisphaeraceae bacterium]